MGEHKNIEVFAHTGYNHTADSAHVTLLIATGQSAKVVTMTLQLQVHVHV